MTRLATLTSCLLLFLLIAPPLTAQPRTTTRDVWIGVIDENGGLAPVSALVGGRWWDWLQAASGEDAEPGRPRRRFLEGVTQRGVQTEEMKWMPLGKPVPTSWHGHLIDGSQKVIRTPGRLKQNDHDEPRFVLDTNLTASLRALPGDSMTKGFAVAGSVEVSAFLEVAEPRRAELLRAWDPRLRDQQWAAVRHLVSSKSPEPTIPEPMIDPKQWSGLTRKDLNRTSFEVHNFVRAQHRDGSVVYFLTGHRTGYGAFQECGLETSVLAHEGDAAELRIDRVHVEPYCGETVTLQPLAVIERDGRRCWLTEGSMEDGTSYGVTTEARMFADRATGGESCNLRD